MDEKHVTIFLAKLPPTYSGHLISQVGAYFTNLVQTGERIKNGLNTGKLKDYQALFKQAYQKKYIESKDKKMYTILDKSPKKFFRCSNVTRVNQLSAPHFSDDSRSFYSPLIPYHSQDQYQEAQPATLLHHLNHLRSSCLSF